MVLWKFGDLDDGLAGRGSAMKVETAVTRLVKMDLPETDVWFIKFAIDPLDRVRRFFYSLTLTLNSLTLPFQFIISGNQIGELHVWPLDKGIPPVQRFVY
jgi:hypothetical protein